MSSSTQSNDEIDLKYIYLRFKKLVHGIIKSLFAAYDFVISKWYIVLSLALIGLGLGYFKYKDANPDNEAKVLLKVNFDTGDALYNAVFSLSEKLSGSDALFMEELGFNTQNPEVKGLEIEPIVNIQDLLINLENENRSLDPLLRYVEFNIEDTELYETFASQYRYHYLTVTLSDEGDSGDIQTILDYINENPALKALSTVKYQALVHQIKGNEALESSLDSFLNKYLNEKNIEQLPGAGYFVEFEERPDLLVTAKTNLLKENLKLKERVVFGDKSVVAINGLEVYPVAGSIIDNYLIFYPFLLVFGFLFLAYIRYSFKRLRKIANAA